MALGATAAHAATVVEMSAPVYWSANGNHADLVLQYGPKGVGALFVRNRTPFLPQTVGGSQERNRRAGTENVAGAVGLATALRLAQEEREARNRHLVALRDRLLDELPRRVPGTIVTGPSDPSRRLPNSASFAFENVEGEAVLLHGFIKKSQEAPPGELRLARRRKKELT